MAKFIVAFVLAITAALPVLSYATGGDLDPSFGQGKGWVTNKSQGAIRSFDDMAVSMLQQADGKSVILGRDELGRIEVSRHLANGTLDNNFSADGLLTITPFADAVAIMQQASGKLLIVGMDANLLRMNTDGSPDASFGIGGLSTAIRDAVPGKSVGFSAATQQANGKIVAVGSGYDPVFDTTYMLLARFNSDGTLDNAFASNGILWLLQPPFSPEKIIQQADGMLVVSGTYSTTPVTWDDPVFSAIRVTSSGALDNAFATAGLFISDVDGWANTLIQQADGRLVIAGESKYSGDFALVRLNSDGSLDDSFNGTGKVFVDVSGDNTSYGGANAIVQDTDNKLVIAGWSNLGSTRDVVLVRFNANGSLDDSFGAAGIVITDMGGYEYGNALVKQPDGKLLVAGEARNPSTSSEDFYLWRYNSDGSADTSFGNLGVATADFRAPDEGAAADAILQQQDGKLLAAGWLYDSNNRHQFGLVRFNFNGALDTTFNGTGEVTTPINTESSIYDIAQQGDGKIVAAGSTYYNDDLGNHTGFAVSRYNLNGSSDTSFGNNGAVTTSVGNGDLAQSVIQQLDGKVVVAGRTQFQGFDYLGNYYDYGSDFAIVRYNTDGTLDATFGGDGIVTTDIETDDIGSDYDGATRIIQQSDGKLVAIGYTFNGVDNDFAVVRYNSNGTLDATFGGGGIVVTPFDARPVTRTGVPDTEDVAFSVVQQPDGKLVVAGGSPFYFELARYNTNGTLDTSFDGDGKITSIFSADSYFQVKRLILQANGKLIIVATDYDFSGKKIIVLTRYTSSGALDTRFGFQTSSAAKSNFATAKTVFSNSVIEVDGGSGADGVITLNFGVGLASPDPHAVFLQADGNLVAAGISKEAPGVNIDNMFVARFDLSGVFSGDTSGSDIDDDGILDDYDNCPVVANADQLNMDVDDLGDVCDIDMDGDGIANYIDADPINSAIASERLLSRDASYAGSSVKESQSQQ